MDLLSLRARNTCSSSDIYYFVRSGLSHYDGNTGWTGINTYYWSCRADSDFNFQGSFGLGFHGPLVGASDYNYRLWGFSLRCLVR